MPTSSGCWVADLSLFILLACLNTRYERTLGILWLDFESWGRLLIRGCPCGQIFMLLRWNPLSSDMIVFGAFGRRLCWNENCASTNVLIKVAAFKMKGPGVWLASTQDEMGMMMQSSESQANERRVWRSQHNAEIEEDDSKLQRSWLVGCQPIGRIH